MMNILEIALKDMCRKRKNEFFFPEDILRQMYPEDWEEFLGDLEELLIQLKESDTIEILAYPNGTVYEKLNQSPIKIRCQNKPKST